MPKEAAVIELVSSVSMIRPGTMKAPYSTPSIDWMREPIAPPNTTK